MDIGKIAKNDGVKAIAEKKEHTKNVGGVLLKEKAAEGPQLSVCVAFGLKITGKSRREGRW